MKWIAYQITGADPKRRAAQFKRYAKGISYLTSVLSKRGVK